jgi:hypothetical protein
MRLHPSSQCGYAKSVGLQEVVLRVCGGRAPLSCMCNAAYACCHSSLSGEGYISGIAIFISKVDSLSYVSQHLFVAV